jgi:hypothetical protein
MQHGSILQSQNRSRVPEQDISSINVIKLSEDQPLRSQQPADEFSIIDQINQDSVSAPMSKYREAKLIQIQKMQIEELQRGLKQK